MKKLKGNFTTILNKIITDKNISGNEFKILCYLCMRSGNDNSCFPSLDTIHQDSLDVPNNPTIAAFEEGNRIISGTAASRHSSVEALFED